MSERMRSNRKGGATQVEVLLHNFVYAFSKVLLAKRKIFPVQISCLSQPAQRQSCAGLFESGRFSPLQSSLLKEVKRFVSALLLF